MKRIKPKYKQIIDAAIVVIAENGFHHSQISKIAKQAGVADGTIYLYFKNKEDLLVSIFQEKMGSFIQKITEEIQSKNTATEKLLNMIESHFKILASDPNLAYVTQLQLRQTNKDIRKKINEILRGYLHLIDEILIEGQKNQEFASLLDIRLARQMIFGTIDETVTSWLMNEQKYDLVALAPAVHHLILSGCSSEKF